MNPENTDKLFLRALKGDVLSSPPIWLMRQAGRYLPEYREVRKNAKNFLNFCYTPDLAVEVTLQPLRRYSLDAAILFSDILVIPDALGQKVEFREGEGPVMEPVRSVSDLKRLSPVSLLDHLSPVFETVSILSREIPAETALIGFAGSPWTVAVYMVEGCGGTDCGQIKRWAFEAPDDFQKLIDMVTGATISYLIEQIKNGAEVIQLFDSWAGVLGYSQFDRWIIKPTAEIVRQIKAKHPEIPIIGFPRGSGIMYEDFVKNTGVDGISLDQTVPVAWARDNLQSQCTIQGNLDNHALVVGGQAVERETGLILETLTRGPFIFNLGHGILQFTPPENVAHLIDFIRNWEAV